MADETRHAGAEPLTVRAIDVAYPQDVWRTWVRELQVMLAERDATIAARDAELAALRDREAAEREIVAAVADTDVMCAQCDMSTSRIHHATDCPVTRARALLATATPPATDDATAQEGA